MTVILLYHRVATTKEDPLGLSVAPGRFSLHLRIAREHAAIVPLQELTSPSSEARIAITFDDGYADQVSHALPALASEQLPATFFLVSGLIDAKAFWWDVLQTLILRPRSARRVRTRIGRVPVALPIDSPRSRGRTFRILFRLLRRRPLEAINRELQDIAVQCGESEVPMPDARPLNTEELQTLIRNDLASIGAHSHTHPRLARLSPDGQSQEIHQSKSILENLTETKVEAFAYPYGDRRSFNNTTRKHLRDHGFALACSNIPRASRRGDRYALPRHVVGDWDAETFTLHLQKWLER